MPFQRDHIVKGLFSGVVVAQATLLKEMAMPFYADIADGMEVRVNPYEIKRYRAVGGVPNLYGFFAGLMFLTALLLFSQDRILGYRTSYHGHPVALVPVGVVVVMVVVGGMIWPKKSLETEKDLTPLGAYRKAALGDPPDD